VQFTYPDRLHVPAIGPDVVPQIAVPTTLSGAEATNIFGITDRDRRVKDAFVSPKFVPKGVIYDPELTLDIPGWLWASSGMRAVDHAVEGVLSKRHMPMADALALEGLKILLAELEHSCREPTDLRSRMQCQLGAWLCIYALTNVGTGLSHGLGHQLAAQFGIVHGVTSACMLPHVVELNSDVTGPQLARLDEIFGGAAIDGLRDFIRRLEPFGVPHTLKEAGARQEELEAVADHTLTDLSVAVNPKPLTRDDLLGLLQAAWS
jgi:alcohol dehydrogenase